MRSGASRVLGVHILAAAVLAPVTLAEAQTGITYRFRENTLVGTAWVLGDDARRELESGENGLAAGRVEIWKDGGKEIFILNPADRTYYELRAFRGRNRTPLVSAGALTVGRPFVVDGVKDLEVDLRQSPVHESSAGYACHRVLLTFSYTLQLRIERVEEEVKGRVEGLSDLCLAEGIGNVSLPFGHGPELTSGHPDVDTAIAKRLAALKGIPVRRLLEVTRRIEDGDAVSDTSALAVSDVRTTEIAPDRFEVPADYRFQEPVVVPPTRRHRPGATSR